MSLFYGEFKCRFIKYRVNLLVKTNDFLKSRPVYKKNRIANDDCTQTIVHCNYIL